MTIGITRIHGSAIPETLTGGYQLAWFTVADTTVDFSVNYESVGSNFEGAVRAIEKDATIVVLGTPTTGNGFVVGIDAATAWGRGDNTGYAGYSAAADLQAAIRDYVSSTATVVTSVVLSGVGFTAGTYDPSVAF